MSGRRVREAGDSALLLELDEEIDRQVNARAVSLAAAVRRASLDGVRDVVPTYRSVAVYFDPLVADAEALRAALHRVEAQPDADAERPLIEVPVVYGGQDGPDLDDVAALAGISPDAVADRHAAMEYRVFMLGFLPGFAYMGTVDASIAFARHPSPRVKIPEGSVGIAGRQTGVYPCESPGGWRIIGRTPVRVFDAARSRPALFAPGDRVRFVRDSVRSDPDTTDVRADAELRRGESVAVSGSSRPSEARRYLTVLHPGLFTTIQDEGRWGHQAIGVPVSGAMDLDAHRLANALVGNDRSAATLEATLVGPALRLESPARVALAGADLGATLDGRVMRPGQVEWCGTGSAVRFDGSRGRGRAYLAFDGGVATSLVLGSRATHVRSRMGGVDGRAIRAGDRLPIGEPAGDAASLHQAARRRPPGGARLRVLRGPQDDFFPPAAFEMLQSARFTVSPESDRMGYRLVSEAPVPRLDRGEMISDATFTGAIQIPGSGQAILLMADRQTSGGYPQIAVVITADLPVAGQLVPGDWVEFDVCSRAEALAALAGQEERSTGA